MESLSRAGRFAVIGRRFNHARGFIDVLARFLGRPARSTLRQIRTGIGSMERSALLSRDTPNKNHSTRYLRRLFVTFLSLICHRAVLSPQSPTRLLRTTTHDADPRKTVACRFAENFAAANFVRKSHASCPMHVLSGNSHRTVAVRLGGHITNADYVSTFLRIIAGIIIFPYGMQNSLYGLAVGESRNRLNN
jgi:hypothetical protein